MNSKGFTIVELLIVIVLLGVISGVVLSVINPVESKLKAEDAVRLEGLRKVVAAITAYHAGEGGYPLDNDGDGNPFNTGSGTETALANYITDWPDDPDLYYRYLPNADRICVSTLNAVDSTETSGVLFKYANGPVERFSINTKPECIGRILHGCPDRFACSKNRHGWRIIHCSLLTEDPLSQFCRN